MADPALSPRNKDQELNDSRIATDPFATPTLNPADLPAFPQPTAHVPTTSPPYSSTGHYTRPTALHYHAAEERAAYPDKSGSMSSAGGLSDMTQISSVDLEKSSRRPSDQRKPRSETRPSREPGSRDPEKGGRSRPRSCRTRSSRVEAQRIAYLEDDHQDEPRQLQEERAMKILLFLSGPFVLLSFLNAIWTIISLLITSMAQPIRLCARRPTFGQQLGRLLGPALNLQLRSIYTPPPPHADEDTSYRPGMLLAVQLLSPFLSLGIMIAAWVVAVFWLSSAVVGDPSGTDKRDDGKETVLALRNWWENWLMKSVRDD